MDTGGFQITNDAGPSTPMSAADLTTLVRSMTYQNTDEAPTGSLRTFSFSVEDSAGKNSPAAVTSLTLVSINDAPVITGLDNVTLTESQANSGPQLVDIDISVVDADSPSFTGGSLTIGYDIADPGSSQDQLAFQDQGTGSGMIGFSGGTVTFEGTVIGTVRPGFDGSNGSPLVIDFTPDATPTAVDALLQQLTYQNTSATPAATRTIQVVIDDGSGGISAAATSQISITAENNPPVLDVSGSPSYLQNDPAVDIAASVSITDLDDTLLESATVTISNVDRANDLLSLIAAALSAAATAGILITGYSPATGELTLSGTASSSDYAVVLDGILFSSTSGDGTDRTISFVVNDGTSASNIDTVTIDYTTDTTPPGQPTITAISTDTGVSSTDGITSDNTLIISGTGDANSTITIFIDGVIQGTTTTDGSGNWSFDYSATTLPDGPYTLLAQSTDTAGNASIPSDPFDVVIDTNSGVGPLSQVPVISSISIDTGDSSTDGITSDNTLVFQGTGQPDSSIELFLDGNSIGTVNVDASGAWTFDYSATVIPDGTYDLTAAQTDLAGNVSLTPSFPIVIDTNSGVGPLSQEPVVSSISIDTGDSSTDGITSDNTLVFQGTGQPDSSIELFLDGSSIGTVNVDASGAWTFDYSATVIPDGTYDLTAAQTDLAGNVSLTPSFPIVIDTTDPEAPTVTALNTNDLPPTITGTWDATDATILEVTVNGTTYHQDLNDPAGSDSQLQANPDGTWSLNLDGEPNLPAGQYDVVVTSWDPANNSSSDTTTNELTIDITAPAAALIAPDMISPSDSGVDDTDNLTNETNPTFSGPAGTGEPGSTVTLYIDGQPVGTATVLPDGGYEVTVSPGHSLVDGPHSVTVTFMDSAGNESPQSPALDIIIDTEAPNAIAIDTPITPDNIVNAVEQLTLVITGTGAEPTSTVEVTLTDSLGNLIGPLTATVNPDGTWSIPATDISSLVDGPITITTSETDAAGNPNVPVTASFLLDTTAPTAAPNMPDLVDSSDSGLSQTDDLTNDTTPTFSGPAGSGEPGSTVTLFIDGEPVGTAFVNPDGSYTVTVPPGAELPDGPHNATTTFTDTAGNESEQSPPLDFVVDSTPPTPPTITSSFPTELTGTGEPGTVITALGPNGDPLLGPDDQPIQTIVNPDGTWTLTGFHPPLTNQDVVTVISTDAAGNSAQSEYSLTIFAYDSFQNMSKPPSFGLPLVRPDSDMLLSQLMFDLGSNPTLSGTARPGTHLVVRMYGIDGSVQAEAYIIADSTGNWITRLPAALPSDAPRIVIEHISTNEIPLGSSGFGLSGPTYSQLLYGVSSTEQGSIMGVLSSTASATLEADHEENLNPLNWF